MPDVLFARTRHHYMPYDDMFCVAELSGYQVVYLDQVDWQQHVTVIGMPHQGEWFGIPTQDKRNAKVVLWNLERPILGTDYHFGGKDLPPNVDEVWTSDRAVAAETGARYVFLGGHPAFTNFSVLERDQDVVTLMAMFGRRTGLIEPLGKFKNTDVQGGTWGDSRDHALRSARVMLSAHQDDLPWIEPPRYMLAGMYALPLVVERSRDTGYYKEGEHYLAGTIEELPDLLGSLLADEVRLARMSAAIWRLVCRERPFRKEVEAALCQSI